MVWAVGALAVLPWLGAVAGGLVYDDVPQIVTNPRLALGDLAGWWTQGEAAWSGVGRPGRYNPLGWSLFVLESSISGGRNPAWLFHGTSLVAHGAATGLLFGLLRSVGLQRNVAVLTALLYGWHPMNSEVACWPAARFESLALIFLLGGAWWARATRGTPAAIAAGAFAAAAVLCKETAGPLALLVPLASPRRGATAGGVAVGLAAAWGLRAAAGVGAPSDLGSLDPVWLSSALVELHRLAWLPTELSLLRPLPLSPAPLAIGVAIAVLAGALRGRHPHTLVGLAWAGAVLAVHALAGSRYQLLPDRYVTLALPGLALAVSPLVTRPFARRLTVAVLAVYAGIAVLQTPRWTDDVALFSHERRIWPEAPAGAYQLGLAHGRAGDVVAAERELLASTRLGPRLPQTWGELAALQANLGRTDDALLTLERGLVALPGNPAMLTLRAQLQSR